MDNKDKIIELQHRHSTLLSQRSGFDVAYRDLADHFLPMRFRDVASSPDAHKQPLLNDKLVDASGILAMRTLAAGLQGGMTSPARPWFQLTLEDSELAEASGVKEWLSEVAKRMRSVFHRSNFYSAVHTLYGDLGTFGTAFMLELADFEKGFRFVPFNAGSYCLETNYMGRVDTVFRRFQMTPRQLVQQFGEKNVPDYIASLHNTYKARNGTEDYYTVVHAIFPRKDRDPNKMGGRNMRFASVYYLDSISGSRGGVSSGSSAHRGHILQEGGFEEFPGFGVRWNVVGNDAYGYSPAMEVLPDCRMLQQMGVCVLKAIHKSVDPPTAVSASLKSVGLDLTPGGVNYVEVAPGQAPQAASPIIQVAPQIQEARMAIKEVQTQIKEGLYNDLFKLLMNSDRRQITATEVASREEEKLVLIGPVLERMHAELFIPLIERTFNLMLRLDALPPIPEQLQGLDIKVEFVSLLAQAQKIVSTSSVDRFVGFALNLAQANPEVLDAMNWDKAVDEYGNYLGVDPSIIKSQEDRDKIRKARADAQAAQEQAAMQQAQMAQGMQSLQGAASAANDLAQIPMDENNVLQAALGGMGSL